MSNSGHLLPALYQVDETGGWNNGMRKISHALLAALDFPNGPVLELGCGGGAFAAELAKRRAWPQIVGLDLQPTALAIADRRAGPVAWVQGDLADLPFAGPTFALIAALDVLDQEGVDTAIALAAIYSLLLYGGLVLLRVSAHPWLYGPHDVAFNTGHRFMRREFESLVRGSGLQPVRVTYANTLLAPPVFAVRLLQRWGIMPFAHELYEDRVLERLIGAALCLEARRSRQRDLPFGVSLFVVARKLKGE